MNETGAAAPAGASGKTIVKTVVKTGTAAEAATPVSFFHEF